MLNLKQTKSLIATTLNGIDLGGTTATNLLLGTLIQESGGTYLQQINGPAVGLLQMEPLTYMDCRHHLLTNLSLRKKILITCYLSDIPDDANVLIGNLSLAIIMARLKYYFNSEPLPDNNPAALAAYYKKIYNTAKGAATIEQATKSFQIACSCI